MPVVLGHLLTAAVVSLVVGLASGGAWAYFVMGAVLALSLWVMVLAGSYATPGRRGDDAFVSVRDYALAAAMAVVLGYATYAVGDDPAWWAVGFIVAGAIIPAARTAAQGSRTDAS